MHRRSSARRFGLAFLVAGLASALTGRAGLAQTAGPYTLVIGGSDRDLVHDIARDASGNIYVVGETFSADFPVVGGVQSTLRGPTDAFIVKLDPTGYQVLYSTYLGGTGGDVAAAVAVDAGGYVYVTGYTSSVDFPLQGALDANRGGFNDAFITKINPQGSQILFSTYLGGANEDSTEDVALDAQGNVYVAGRTRSSSGFAVNAAQPLYGGNEDAFVAKLNASLTSYAYITYLGGSELEIGNAIDVDAAGRVCVAGQTASGDLPTVNAPQATQGGGAGVTDAFYAVLNAGGTAFDVTSYLGGSDFDAATAVACNGSTLAVAGETRSTNFPTGSGGAAIQATHGGDSDGFLAVFSLTTTVPTRAFATYDGGRRADRLVSVGLPASGGVNAMGQSASSGLPEVGVTPTGLIGAGMFRSTDQGLTWAPSGLQGIAVNDLARASSAPARLLAATDLGLYVSTDEGSSWQLQTGYAARVVHSVTVHPSDACTWVIGVDSAASDSTPVGAARTTDCGATWSPWGGSGFLVRDGRLARRSHPGRRPASDRLDRAVVRARRARWCGALPGIGHRP